MPAGKVRLTPLSSTSVANQKPRSCCALDHPDARSIIGPQQHFMRDMERTMWREGDIYRQSKVVSRPPTLQAEQASSRRDAEQHAKIDTMSSNLGSLVLDTKGATQLRGQASSTESPAGADLRRSQRLIEARMTKAACETPSDGDRTQTLSPNSSASDESTERSQGDRLRARRAMGIGNSTAGPWSRGQGTRLVRK